MSWSADTHIEWLLTKGRHEPDLNVMFQGLGQRLYDHGCPVQRVRLAMRTVHPLVAAVSAVWDADPDNITDFQVPHGLETRSAYQGSPIETISNTGLPLRIRLDRQLGTEDHLIIHELKAQGIVEYFALPLFFALAPMGGFLAFNTARAGGFDDRDIAEMTKIAVVLAPVIETYAQHYMATAIAKSYLGPRTGQKVLDGQITRGDIETTEAAILFSDIRGWTALNASHPPEHVLDVANRYFEVISEAVGAHDGEILKFMGDGVLALFPNHNSADGGQQRACQNALDAAKAAHQIAAQAEQSVPFGVGIHYGELLYGNVGAQERLDFTVLGQSVNIAARIEAFCGPLSETVLMSNDVARLAGANTRYVSTEDLKGLEKPMCLFAPDNS